MNWIFDFIKLVDNSNSHKGVIPMTQEQNTGFAPINTTSVASNLADILKDTPMAVKTQTVITPSEVVPQTAMSLSNIVQASTKLKVANNTYGTKSMNSRELTLSEKGDVALTSFLNSVQPYTKDDWNLAYGRLGFEFGKQSPSTVIQYNCISDELHRIASASSLNITHYLGDTYIFNGEFWVKLEQEQAIHFVRDFSIKMGIKKYDAVGVKFGEDLYKQVVFSSLQNRKYKSADELLLNMGNGTLLIDNDGIEMRPFNHEDFLTYQLGFDYNPKVINNDWLNFLNDVLPDIDSQKTLQQALGSLLLRGLKLEKVILLYGTGANGKSVVFEVLKGLLGEESMSHYSLNSLTGSKGYHRSYLKDKLINYASDIDLSAIDAGTFKTLASGEPIECRLPYEKPMIMKDYAKLIFNLNDISTAKKENTEGFYRRMLFIPFEVTIPQHKQDKNLHKKLLQNKEGILNWLLDGARAVLQSEEIFESQESQDFLRRFQNQPTSLEKFILSRNVQVDTERTILSSELYDYYLNTCSDSIKPLSQIGFSKQLVEKGFSKERASDGVHWQASLTA